MEQNSLHAEILLSLLNLLPLVLALILRLLVKLSTDDSKAIQLIEIRKSSYKPIKHIAEKLARISKCSAKA